MLARTEVMRAHHEAQRMQMLQNADLLAGWRWSAATDSDTCPLCWANHNRVFPLHEVDANSPTDMTRAQHRGLEDHLTKAGIEKAGTGRVDADALPAEAKAPASNEAQRTAVRLAERATWRNPRETLQVFDADGSVILNKSGTESSVAIEDAELDLMAAHPGAVATHNHPSGWNYVNTGPGGDRSMIDPTNIGSFASDDVRWQGTGPSRNDFDLAIKAKFGELRVVSPAHSYSVRPPVGSPTFHPRLQREYDQVEREVKTDFYEKIRQGTLTVAEANTRHAHEVLTRLSARTGIVYSRTPIADELGGYTDA
jgi:hypothetical protein